MDEIYTWLEQYAGTSYDFQDSVQSIGTETAFISPFEWRISIEEILRLLDEATDVIDEHWRELPGILPHRNELKRLLSYHTLYLIMGNVRRVCEQMNIELHRIQTVDQLKVTVVTIAELIDMLINNTLDDIIKKELFNLHEEENDDSFSEILDLDARDMSQLSYNVNAIRQSYFEMASDDDET